MRSLLTLSRVFALVLLLFVWATSLQAQGSDYIILFRDGVTPSARAAAIARAGGGVRFNYNSVSAAAVRVPNANALAVLASDPAVVEIVPDRPVFAIQERPIGATGKGKPGGDGGSTTGQTIPLGVMRVGTPTSASNGEGVGVAIVDTGIDFAHSDLNPSRIAAFSAFGSSCQDDNGHGTHVAGIVAALNNSTDVVGVAPKATPYCVKVLNAAGSGSDATIIAGLEWILANRNLDPPLRVVNMSLGRQGTLNDNPVLRAAVQNLYNVGIVVVVAAGNDPALEVKQNVPATYPEVLAVASTTAVGGTNKCRFLGGSIFADTASYFTTDGKFDVPITGVGGIGVTISAPGEDREDVSTACLISSTGILSTRLGGGTTRMSGTSMAAPHVAGVVARILQPTPMGMLNVESVRTALRGGAVAVSGAPLDSPTSSYTFDGEREGIAQAP